MINDSGIPLAILTSRPNCHPFQERRLKLEKPVKVGRSVARIRASAKNAIFDCKVLSRDHAIIYYENNSFYIQDTKSSNGTFVNNQQLKRDSVDGKSLPRQIKSGDILQFGVDILENPRKVIQNCIVASVTLFHPGGREAILLSSPNVSDTTCEIFQQDLRALQVVIQEATQREERLRGKLEELASSVLLIEETSTDVVNHYFEESTVLSKIVALEKRIQILSKLRTGEARQDDVVAQLLTDIEKLQGVSREIQERLHRDLISTEDSITEARTYGDNLLTEALALKNTSKINEEKIRDLTQECFEYACTVKNLELMLKDQSVELEGLRLREEMFQKLSTHPIGKLIYDYLEEGCERIEESGGNLEVVLAGLYDRFLPNQKNQIDLTDVWMLIEKLFEGIFVEIDQSKQEYKSLVSIKQSLIMKLEIAKSPFNSLLKTDSYIVQESNGLENSQEITKNNETANTLERELKEMDDIMLQARRKRKSVDFQCRKIKEDLEIALESNSIENVVLKEEKIDPNEPETLTFQQLRHIVENHCNKTEGGGNDCNNLLLSNKHEKSTQTDIISISTKETSTDNLNDTTGEQQSPLDTEQVASTDRNEDRNNVDADCQTRPCGGTCSLENSFDSSELTCAVDSGENCNTGTAVPQSVKVDDIVNVTEAQPEALSLWEKIGEIYSFCDESEKAGAEERLRCVKEMMDLVSEDMVTLLVHERKREIEVEELRERVSQQFSRGHPIAWDIKTIIIVSLIAFAIYNLLPLV